jgi:hypothetical protein
MEYAIKTGVGYIKNMLLLVAYRLVANLSRLGYVKAVKC